jgi:hypothetical protein
VIHIQARWPFIETRRVREARSQYNEAVKQRPRVDSLYTELTRRGRVNHFAEQWEELLRNGNST